MYSPTEAGQDLGLVPRRSVRGLEELERDALMLMQIINGVDLAVSTLPDEPHDPVAIGDEFAGCPGGCLHRRLA